MDRVGIKKTLPGGNVPAGVVRKTGCCLYSLTSACWITEVVQLAAPLFIDVPVVDYHEFPLRVRDEAMDIVPIPDSVPPLQ